MHRAGDRVFVGDEPVLRRGGSARSRACTCLRRGPAARTLRIWWVLPSRTSARTALFAISSSNAATMPPPMRGIEPLRDHAREAGRELHPDLVLAFGREHVGDAVERLRRVVRVQGREHEVTGLGDRERELHGLGVAHLTHEDHVGVFTQARRAARARKCACRCRPRAGSPPTTCACARTRPGLRS